MDNINKAMRNQKRSEQRKVVRLLTKARDLITKDPSGRSWTKGEDARDARRQPVEPTDPKAKCFCSVGAMERARHDLGYDYDIKYRASQRLEAVMCHQDGNKFELIPDANDHPRTTFPQVVMSFDLAIVGAGK